ncbi:MAG: polysaccharide biosynthesis C-terminal domain-containing protein [Candidatus Obscuribacterales bacterium]|nr:polysaccharide biosynthesis C-terminal domain-containing protein [Candidatus Obscuribacterales bacterium]
MTNDKKAAQASLGRTFGIVAILTVLSKVIGLARDVIVAHAYGTSIVADAYNYAYLFTGNILILFGGLGGPFHSATVAILTPRKDDENSGRLLSQVFLFTFAALLIVSVAAYFLAPFLAEQMAAGYKIIRDPGVLPPALQGLSDSALQNLLKKQIVEQFLIMLPLIVISGLVGISYGILNVYNRIFWPSLSPAIASIAIVIAIWGFTDPKTAAFTGIPLAVGTLIGALGQLVAQIPDMLKTRLKWGLSFKAMEGWNEYSAMIWPAIFSTSVGQLTVYVDAFFTRPLGQGAWTAILMSNRLVQLPLGVLLTAMLVPILPRFTEQVNLNKIDDLKDELRRSLRFLWFLALPLCALFIAIPGPIIRLLFQHGEFTTNSTHEVSMALLFLAPSIFFYVARDLMTRVFYAFKDSKTPFHVAVVAIVVKALLDWLFVYKAKLGVEAISLASTLITMINLSLLTMFLKKKIGQLGFGLLLKPLLIMLCASLVCAGTAYLITESLSAETCIQMAGKVLPSMSKGIEFYFRLIVSTLALGLATGCGGILYFAVCLFFKLPEPSMLAARLPIVKKYLNK